MVREEGKRYSSSTLSGFGSEQEVRDEFSRNYQRVPVEVVREGSDYVVYFEDENGVEYFRRNSTISGNITFKR
ncbi:hypothetical protein [Pseudomonas fluorescens]|uniref:hypothetical protein n=1 Tax=Pseudomonas fluorescens TaxID=294 RepID=UPI0013B42A55|nr:hypothetical protein [Pseudomonas fluorescens]WJK12321.1 hypothetical protein QR290_13590 [Pseudomonas fluorescens]